MRNGSRWLSYYLFFCVFACGSIVFSFWSYNAWYTPDYDYHTAMTTEAIRAEFSDLGTLKKINQEHWNCDDPKGPRYLIHAVHFDSEAFQDGTARLKNNLNDALSLLSECRKADAITKLGEAIHALQDFYAHSTWVEDHLSPNATPSDIPICTLLVTLNADGFFVAGPLAADPDFIDPSWDEGGCPDCS